MKSIQKSILFIIGTLAIYSCTETSSFDEISTEGTENDIEQFRAACSPMVSTVAELMDAVNNGNEGDRICIAAGTYRLTEPLQPKNGMTITGAIRSKTIITAVDSWDPGTDDLPDNATDNSSVNTGAYLIDLGNSTNDVSISSLTLTAPKLHGAIYGNDSDGLRVFNSTIRDFLWSGIRTFRLDNGRIFRCSFIDAGDRHSRPNGPTATGAAIFATFTGTSNFYENVIRETSGSERDFYGIKGRVIRNSRIFRNTITVNFSIEFPFDNDSFVEIDRNYLTGTVSIPKAGGGAVPDGGYTYHIHHNYFRSSYSLEWARNGVEIDHNLFDFSTNLDAGNLITSFGDAPSPGATNFHDNFVKNPGRGIFWARGIYNNITIANNHIVTNTTVTPRTDGLFGLNPDNDFSTISIKNNIIECIGTPRPLFRNTESYQSQISNNQLVNVSDVANYSNPQTDDNKGPDRVRFNCGARLAFAVDGFTISRR